MCDVTVCELSPKCHRHKDSGTRGDPIRQSYFLRPDEFKGPCEHYWPKEPQKVKKKPKVKDDGGRSREA